jgi:hypothetical protein
MKPFNLSQYMYNVAQAAGAGLMGYNAANTYPAGTVGAALKAAVGSGFVLKTGDTMTGNLNFSGSGLRITGDFSGPAAGRLSLQSSTANGATAVDILPNGTSLVTALQLYNKADPNNSGLLNIIASDTLFNFVADIAGTGGYLPIAFGTSGAERMRILTTGQIGININPVLSNSMLQVSGDISMMFGGSFSYNAYNDGTNWKAAENGYSTTIGFNPTLGTYVIYNTAASNTANATIAFSERFRINANGFVGLNNGTPHDLLDVNGGLLLHHGQFLYCGYDAAGSWYGTVRCGIQFDGANSNLNFYTGNQPVVQVQSTGNLLANRPNANIAVQPSGCGGSSLNSTGDGTNSGYVSFFIGTGARVGYIGFAGSGAGGNINYQSENGGGHNFGQALYAPAYNPSSDLRLKTNIQPANDSGALIDAIDIVQFDWKETGLHQSYGIIAQELYEVYPEAVTPADENLDTWHYDPARLLMLALKEIQSLRARVAALEAA